MATVVIGVFPDRRSAEAACKRLRHEQETGESLSFVHTEADRDNLADYGIGLLGGLLGGLVGAAGRIFLTLEANEAAREAEHWLVDLPAGAGLVQVVTDAERADAWQERLQKSGASSVHIRTTEEA